MKKHTHHISVIVLLMLVLSMLVSACTGGDHLESEPETGREIVITSGQLESETFISTAETTIAVTDADVITTTGVLATTTTTAPLMTTTAPITSTAVLTTTAVPVTTTAPITTTQPTITTVPVTPPNRSVTTTKVPTTTTTKTPTTTKAPVTAAPHTHSYGSWTTTKAATCTASGTQKRTCSCGASETKTIAATGHSYGAYSITKNATCTADGQQTRTCKTCGDQKTETIAKTNHSYGAWTLCSDYVNEEATCKTCGQKTTQRHLANPETDEQLVADRVIYYVNQFRKEEGSTTVEKLLRMTLVAQMRSTQLVGLTASDPSSKWHSSSDLDACGTYYEYGKKTANRTYDPVTDTVTYDGTYFYAVPCQEAVGYSGWNSDAQTIDDIGYQIANQVHASSGHWNYVGSSDYSYIAVGVTESYGRSYFAIFVSDTNQYE